MTKRSKNSKCERGEYKSCFEYDFANYMARENIDFEYEKDKFSYTLPKKRYTVDWRIKTKSGKYLIVETKGGFDASDKAELVALKKCNPDIDIRLVFARNNKINKFSKTRNLDWAEKNGFKAAINCIPKEWLEE